MAATWLLLQVEHATGLAYLNNDCFVHCCSACAAGLLLVLIRWLPESPRWLLAQGDTAGAAAVLQQVAQVNNKPVLQLPYLTAAADTFLADTHAAGSSAEALKGAAGSAERHQQRPPVLRTSSFEDPNPETVALLSDRSSNRSSISNDLASPQSDIELTVSPTAQQASASEAQATHQHRQQPHDAPSQHYAGARSRQQQQDKPTHGHAPVLNKSSSSIQVLVAEVQHAFSTLWGKPYASTTNLLLFSWAAVACAYYGLVQLEGQMHIQGAGSHGGSAAACIDGRLQVRMRWEPRSKPHAKHFWAAQCCNACMWPLACALCTVTMQLCLFHV